jgi:hypothetical protein
MRYFGVLLAAVALFGTAFAAGAVSSTAKVKPSKAAAIKAVKKEIRSDSDYALLYVEGSKLSVSCGPLTKSLYKCTWSATVPDFADWFGKAKVKFFSKGTDVTLYGVKCFNQSDVSNFCD